MDRGLNRPDPFDILRLLPQKRIGEAFGTAGGYHPPLHQLGKAEGSGNYPDGADDRAVIHPDMIARTGQPIAARRRDILDKGMNRDRLFRRQPPDARGNQARLHRRSARRIDHQRHGRRFHPKGLFDQRPKAGIVEPARSRADHTGKADHRHEGRMFDKGDVTYHAPEVILARRLRKPLAAFCGACMPTLSPSRCRP